MTEGGESSPALVMGIESSCDDTACALLDERGRVLVSVVSSQLGAHAPFGGVVPEIASREHLRNWRLVQERAFEQAGVAVQDVTLVTATRGPGLVGSLMVGLALGKALAYALQVPFYAINHLEGHLYSPFLSAPEPGAAPLGRTPAAKERPEAFSALIVSGGHTLLARVAGSRVELLGQTRDDAMGECFDKIGKRLGLVFPAGAEVDRLAESFEAQGGVLGPAAEYPFRVARCGDSLDFSYSGLKTQGLLAVETLEAELKVSGPPLLEELRLRELLAAFRRAAVEQLIHRLERAHRLHPMKHLAVSGGAAANRLLRRRVASWAKKSAVELHLVPLVYSGDNAAMIAFAGLVRSERGDPSDSFEIEAVSRLPPGQVSDADREGPA